MSGKLSIICPSRKRSEQLMTNIEGMILFVHQSEKKDYQNAPFELVTHKEVGLSAIRQAAYKKFAPLFMVDDDIVSVERLYTTENQRMRPKETRQIIDNCYQTALSIGASLFGFNNNPSPTHYNQHKPYQLNGYINGCAFGLMANENLYFHAETTACESHWINLLNAHHNRYCFIDKRFHFRQQTDSTFTKEGGQTGRRTTETELNDTMFLRKMFGESVVLKREKNKTKQLHPFQRQLNIRL